MTRVARLLAWLEGASDRLSPIVVKEVRQAVRGRELMYSFGASLVAENYSLYANRFVNYEYYSDNWSHSVRWVNNVSRYSQAHNARFFAWHPGNVGVTFEGNYGDKPNKSVGNEGGSELLLLYREVG